MPAHVTLAVVLQVRDGELQALLWQRARAPFKGSWSLPGGYLDQGDTLEDSIRRHLAEKVDVRELSHLEQLETLSDPKRSPKEWQLATAYLGLVPSDVDPELPGDTDWHPVDDLPAPAFDHDSIVLAGRERLRAKLSYTNLGFALAPARVHDLGAARSLRSGARTRRLGNESPAVLLRREVLEPTGRRRASGPTGGRPGSLFRFRTPELEITDQFAVLRPPGPARLPVSYSRMDLGGLPARRVGARWRALEATSAPGFGAHSRDRSPTSKRCSDTTGPARTALRTWSSTIPPRPRTSRRRHSSPRCAARPLRPPPSVRAVAAPDRRQPCDRLVAVSRAAS